MFRVGILIVLLCSLCVWGQKPLCSDPNRPPGACFIPLPPGTWYFSWAGPDGLVGVGPLDPGLIYRINPTGAQRTFYVDHDLDVLYCPMSALVAGDCFTPSGEPNLEKVYFGKGRVNVQATLAPGSPPIQEYFCPAVAHIRAEVKSPENTQLSLRAVYHNVKDKDSPTGCRVVSNEVTLKAK
jgi:hypothetical protein